MSEIVILVFLTAASDDAAVQKEAKLLAGNWEVVSAERRGEKFPLDKLGIDAIVFAAADPNGKKESKGSATFRARLDPAKSPKRIEANSVEGKKATLNAIYALDGETLTICLSPTAAAPAEFKTNEGSGETILLHLRRVKALAKPKDAISSAKLAKARIDAIQLTTAAAAYKIKFENYPEKLSDLLTPPDGKPFIEPREDVLKDPWGKPYKYDPKGPKNNGDKPDIWSEGPDGKGPIIGNWPEAKKTEQPKKE